MFVEIRDFTPFAGVNTAEDTVSRLNALRPAPPRRPSPGDQTAAEIPYRNASGHPEAVHAVMCKG